MSVARVVSYGSDDQTPETVDRGADQSSPRPTRPDANPGRRPAAHLATALGEVEVRPPEASPADATAPRPPRRRRTPRRLIPKKPQCGIDSRPGAGVHSITTMRYMGVRP